MYASQPYMLDTVNNKKIVQKKKIFKKCIKENIKNI